MTKRSSKQHRILAIAPSCRGFGFAVIEGAGTLVDWGVKSVRGDKNAESLKKVRKLMTLYRPNLVVLPNLVAEKIWYSARIRTLNDQIAEMIKASKTDLALLSRTQVRRAFFGEKPGTKHELAKILAGRYPEELGTRLPPKRRIWMSENYRMDIFEAVALAVSILGRNAKSLRKMRISDTSRH